MSKLKLILEFTEFNAQRLNPDSAQMSISVDNPQLSINAFDKHEDGIRAGISRINNIMFSLSNTNSFRVLKSRLSLDDQNLKSLKVLRITNPTGVNWDVFVSFVIDDFEYFGVIKNIVGGNTEFKSEIFKDFDLVQSKEWRIKISGMIIKCFREWLRPDLGKWHVIKDYITCISDTTGKSIKLEKGKIVEVIRSYDNKIVIKFGDDFYNLLNDNWIYFNYWFEKIKEE